MNKDVKYCSPWFEGVRTGAKLKQEVIALLCGGKKPTLKSIKIDEDRTDPRNGCDGDLHGWCVLHCEPQWMTGLSVTEAADLILEGAIENGNIIDVEDTDACRRALW